jgi:stage V sporulation protein G
MEVTEVKVFPAKKGPGRLKGYAQVVFDSCFIVRNLKIIEGNSGRLFVSMPSERRPNGVFRDIVHPLNSGTRSAIEDMVLQEFRRVIDSGEYVEDTGV